MEQIVVSIAGMIAAKIAEYLVDPIIRYASYVFCVDKFLDDSQKARTELERGQKYMKEQAERATINAEKVVEPVETWLIDVEKVLEEVRKLEERADASKSCLNVNLEYSLTEKLASLTQRMNELNKLLNKLRNGKISEPVELPGMRYFSSKDFVLFESRKSAYDELLKAIHDDRSNVIGLVGMGGSGKTRMAKEVGKKVEELKLFQKVLITTVSQDPNVEVIQRQIAEQLGFKLEEKTEVVREQRLSLRLKTQKILIILDDVWKKLDLEAIGIPLNENDTKCSILLTTRKQKVCKSMGCQSIIKLSMLTENEGLTLFKQCAQIADDSSEDLRRIAKTIADKCQGLLIAILTMASTLKGEDLGKWKLALLNIENSQPIDVDEDSIIPYACLKSSYENLTNQLAKSLFLMCCMFPEDHEIHMEDLVRFGRGLLQVPGLNNLGPMHKMRMEFNSAVKTLVDCYLLEPTDEDECVKMHDMVRDAGLWIASNERQKIMVATKEIPSMLNEDENIKDTMIISLWNLQKLELSDQLLCPALKILLHHVPDDEYVMPHSYLERTNDLKVLALTTFSYTWDGFVLFCLHRKPFSIPKSIESLTNLQTLCLRGYKLGDISILGSIKGLEILDLRCSSIIELPNGIGALKKLKLLDLFYCDIEKNNPYEVITRCSLLQELYISARGDYSVENVSFPKLDRYFIWLSEDDLPELFHFQNQGEPRYLRIDLEDFDKYALNESIKYLILKAEELHLENIQGGHENIILDMDKQHLNRLISLRLDFCSGIKCLVDTATLDSTTANSVDVTMTQAEAVFPELVSLSLLGMHDLEELIRGPFSGCSLQKLQKLWMASCPHFCSASFLRNFNLCNLKRLFLSLLPQLKSPLFTPSTVPTFVMLEGLEIYECKILEGIMAQDIEEGNKLLCFPRLRYVEVHGCPNLKTIFSTPVFISLPELQELSVGNCHELEQIFSSDSEEAGQLRNQSVPSEQVCFPNLWSIRIDNCNKLKCISSYSMACHCPRLQQPLSIGPCSKLEQVVKFEHKATGDEGGGAIVVDEEHGKHVLFPRLSILSLRELPNLTMIYPGYEFKSDHKIEDCPNYMSSSIYALSASLRLRPRITHGDY